MTVKSSYREIEATIVEPWNVRGTERHERLERRACGDHPEKTSSARDEERPLPATPG